jgi:hypothetical protein
MNRHERRSEKHTKSRLTWIKGDKYVIHLIPMFKSPSYRVMSRAAEKILRRLEIELSEHAGKNNGDLIVTFAQFEEFGVHRNAIAPAIRELVALGFLEVTEQGRAGNAEFRRPAKYRLTYLPTADAEPTHEWRQITEDDAGMIAQGARRSGSNSARLRLKKTESRPRKAYQEPPVFTPESVPTSPPKAYQDPH